MTGRTPHHSLTCSPTPGIGTEADAGAVRRWHHTSAQSVPAWRGTNTVPLDVEVHVLSSASRRFLEVLGKLDQLMPLLQTLEIHEVITAQAVDIQRAGLKRQVRDIANGARNFAIGLRRRMNALDARNGESAREDVTDAETEQLPESSTEGDVDVMREAAAAPMVTSEAAAELPVAVEE
jgi:hypothetical protein